MENKNFRATSIGTIHAGGEGFSITIDEPCRKALNGLEGFSHIQVIWWGHLTDDDEYRSILECEKPYTRGPEKLGIFATRSPIRPNPIEVSTVAVISVDEKTGTILIPWIDAENGSPVLDIKPYHPSEDRVKSARVPAWCGHWPEWMEDSENFNWEDEFTFG